MLHRLMVGQRILTPSILVRVQVKQPTKMPLKRGFFCWVIYHWTRTLVRNRIASRLCEAQCGVAAKIIERHFAQSFQVKLNFT